MSFIFGLSVGSLFGFFAACFCMIAAHRVKQLSTDLPSGEAFEEASYGGGGSDGQPRLRLIESTGRKGMS